MTRYEWAKLGSEWFWKVCESEDLRVVLRWYIGGCWGLGEVRKKYKTLEIGWCVAGFWGLQGVCGGCLWGCGWLESVKIDNLWSEAYNVMVFLWKWGFQWSFLNRTRKVKMSILGTNWGGCLWEWGFWVIFVINVTKEKIKIKVPLFKINLTYF